MSNQPDVSNANEVSSPCCRAVITITEKGLRCSWCLRRVEFELPTRASSSAGEDTQVAQRLAERIIEQEAGVPFDSPVIRAEFVKNCMFTRLIDRITEAISTAHPQATVEQPLIANPLPKA